MEKSIRQDELAIWDHALSADNIHSLYNNTTDITEQETSLPAFLKIKCSTA